MNLIDIDKPHSISISKTRWEKKLVSFSERVSRTTNYSDCGQTSLTFKTYQHFVGKLIELSVFFLLTEYGFDPKEPDFSIYEKKDKSWLSDLSVDGFDISVKGQDLSSAKRFGLSWTFQNIQDGRKDSALRKQNEVVMPGLYDNSKKTNYHTIIFPPKKMGEILFEEPKKDSLKGKKKVMYAHSNYTDVNKWLTEADIKI